MEVGGSGLGGGCRDVLINSDYFFSFFIPEKVSRLIKLARKHKDISVDIMFVQLQFHLQVPNH